MDCFAINPLTGENIPIYLDSNEDFGEKTSQNIPFLTSKIVIPSFNEDARNFCIERKIDFKEIYNKKLNKLKNSEEVIIITNLIFSN